jgi:DNA-binding CsgD family transcriptional regulator
MDFESAMQWVQNNRKVILKYAVKFMKFTPYSQDDFLSAAKEAAIVTEMHIEGTDISFDKYFWSCYDTVLSSFVPIPDPNYKDWSFSIPSDLCDYPADITLVPELNEDPELTKRIDEIYDHIEQHLKPRQKTILRLLLGLDEEGSLSPAETAIVIGYTRQGVTALLNRLCNQLRHLIDKGSLDFSFLFDDVP